MRLVLASLLAVSAVFGAVQTKTKKINGTTIEYKVVLPAGYDAVKEYPAVLAFPGGGQTLQIAEGMVERNFKREAEARGYIVVVPAAPGGVLYFEGSEKLMPEFIKQVLADYKVRGGKFHMAGVSNGGVSAMHVAAANPQYFTDITVFPGYLPDFDDAHVKAVSKMCIHMYAGGEDPGWRDDMLDQAARFKAKGVKVTTSVEKGQPHRIETLAGDGAKRLFAHFEQTYPACGE